MSMRIRLTLLSILLLSQSGCIRNSDPIHFYMLAPIETPNDSTGTAPAGDGPVVGLGPIRVAAYLDRPQIVTALSPQEYKLAEDRRWTERLEDTIPRVLAQNLSILIPTDKVVPHPWGLRPRLDAQVGVNIQEFHADDSGEVRLTALWVLKGSGDSESRRKFTCRQPASVTDYATIAAAQSECLARLSRELAAQIRALVPASRTAP